MTVTRPYYEARVLGLPDVPVAVREDAGRLILDSARAPHLTGSVVLSVPDPALLDDLDPRDARRLVLDVYPESHDEPVYTPWVEQRRNVNPTPQTFPVRGSATRTQGVVWGGSTWTRFDVATNSHGTRQLVPLASLVSGQTYTYIVEVANPTSTAIIVDINWNNVAASASTVTIQPGDVVILRATGARAYDSTYRFGDVGARAGQSFLIRTGTVVAGSDTGAPFDGSTNPAGTLGRTRWLGSTNNSASVTETRAQTGWEQVPDGTARSFDLGVREATPSRADATVTLQLASDEAVLDDYAQLADDKTPRTHQASLRAVVNYVLGKIGATLQPGATDADVTAYWQVVNQITNPRLALDATGWQTGSGASSGGRVVMNTPLPAVGNTAYRWTASAGESNVVPVTSRYRVTPGKWYVFFAYICSGTARQARAAIQWWSAGGSVASSTALGALVNSDVTAFRQVAVIAKCPPGAEEAVPYVSTLGNAAGNLHYATMSMLYEGDELVEYFDGATPDTARYEYEFQAAAHNSTSTRTPTVERPPAALTWRAGVSGLQFLAPLVQASGFRLVCDERRRWTLRDASYRETGTQTYRERVNITQASEQLSRSAEDWFDGIVLAYTWTDDDGIEQTMYDTYALAGATKVIRREIRAPYPGPGRAQYAVTRAQGRGRTVTATKQADWTEHAEQTFSALLDGTPIQIGTADRVEFDISANTVTTTSRTTDTPVGAIVLLPGTINALPGTINNL